MLPSGPAKAGHPVITEHSVFTGSPAFAGDDEGELQPQYRLRDDVLLDLVGAAVDRDLAPVEVLRRERRAVVGADRRLVPAILVGVAELIRQRVGADRLPPQTG